MWFNFFKNVETLVLRLYSEVWYRDGKSSEHAHWVLLNWEPVSFTKTPSTEAKVYSLSKNKTPPKQTNKQPNFDKKNWFISIFQHCKIINQKEKSKKVLISYLNCLLQTQGRKLLILWKHLLNWQSQTYSGWERAWITANGNPFIHMPCLSTVWSLIKSYLYVCVCVSV